MRITLIALTLLSLLAACAKQQTDSQRFLIKANEQLRLKEYDEAIRLYGEAIGRKADYTEAFNNRGIAWYEQGKYFEAIQDFSQSLRIDTGFHDAYFNRINAYLDGGYYERGLADCQKLKRYYPDSALVWSMEGMFLNALHRYPETVPVLDKAITLQPYYSDYINRGLAWYNQYRYEEAERDFAQALELNPAEASVWNNLGLIKLEQGSYDSALQLIEKAIAIEGSQDYYLNNKGLCLLKMGQGDEALRLINEAIAKNPANYWALRNKGIYYYDNGDPANALRLLQQVQEKEPTVMHLDYYLGLAHRALGDATQAEAAFAEAGAKGDPLAVR